MTTTRNKSTLLFVLSSIILKIISLSSLSRNKKERKNEKTLICKATSGADVSSFFQTGKTTLHFNEPLCTVKRGDQNWNAKMHILRRSFGQQQVLLLMNHIQNEFLAVEHDSCKVEPGFAIHCT